LKQKNQIVVPAAIPGVIYIHTVIGRIKLYCVVATVAKINET